MKTIIIPTDFSDIANNAMDFAIELARKMGSRVLIVHIARKNLFNSLFSHSNQISHNRASDNMKELELSIKSKTEGVMVDYKIIDGSFTDVLNELYYEIDADLIVMGTRAESKVRRIIWGSNTLDVIEKVDCPLLVVPAHSSFHDIKRILYATDFKFLEKFTLSVMKKIAMSFDAEILITNIIINRDKKRYSKDEHREMRREEKMLAGAKFEFKRVYRSSIIDGLSYYVNKKKNIDMVTLIPRRQNSLYSYLFKRSTTKQIALRPKLPTLVLRGH